jgi:hypothetical protein
MMLEVLYNRCKRNKNRIRYDLLRHRAKNQKAYLSCLDLLVCKKFIRVEDEINVLFDATYFQFWVHIVFYTTNLNDPDLFNFVKP